MICVLLGIQGILVRVRLLPSLWVPKVYAPHSLEHFVVESSKFE
jgi:hypothetical protein